MVQPVEQLPLVQQAVVSEKNIYWYRSTIERAKIIALVIKSSHWEGIFVDDKGVNWKSLEIVSAKKIFYLLKLKG